MELLNVVNPIMVLFNGPFPNARTAEGTEMSPEEVADVGDLKKLPIGYVILQPSLDKGNVSGISTNRPENYNALWGESVRTETRLKIAKRCHEQL